ncbi:hypothetical protein GGI26_003229 [Coemansia sp. RSA 1358]|nr:hypothetical protein GGI26_003229 [Coemansia sp. RSA 1358]
MQQSNADARRPSYELPPQVTITIGGTTDTTTASIESAKMKPTALVDARVFLYVHARLA